MDKKLIFTLLTLPYYMFIWKTLRYSYCTCRFFFTWFQKRKFIRLNYRPKCLNKMFFVLTWDKKSNKITLVSHGIVSFCRALTKQAWQLLSPENSGRLEGGQRAEWRSHVVHSVALGAVKVTHTRSRWHQSPQVANSLLSLSQCHRVCWRNICYIQQHWIWSQESTGNVKKRAHRVNTVWVPFMRSWTLWKVCDNKAALSWILSHVKDKCFHHFSNATLDISAAAVPENNASPLKSVYSFSSFYSTLIRQKAFPCSATIAAAARRAPQRRRRSEFVRLMKVPFWPTYNFVQSYFLSLRLLWCDIKSTQRSRLMMTPAPCHPIGLLPHVDRGNPIQLWICSTLRLAAGNDELEVTRRTPFQHCLTCKGSGWRHSLLLTVSLCIPDLSPRTLVSFACLCILYSMN